MNFGIFYEDNKWHVITIGPKFTWALEGTLVASCNNIYISMEYGRNSVYPVEDLGIKYAKFSYKSLCKECIKKYNLTETDIVQHIINTKLGVKIPD